VGTSFFVDEIRAEQPDRDEQTHTKRGDGDDAGACTTQDTYHRSGDRTMTTNEVDHATSGLGRELRAVMAAGLALAQLAAQRRARAAEQRAREAGAAEQEVAQRVAAEGQLHAAGPRQWLLAHGLDEQELGRLRQNLTEPVVCRTPDRF
jgi:hypothetical protein